MKNMDSDIQWILIFPWPTSSEVTTKSKDLWENTKIRIISFTQLKIQMLPVQCVDYTFSPLFSKIIIICTDIIVQSHL